MIRGVALADARTIVVPVDGSPASLEAVGLACRLARQRKGNVYAIYVIEVDRTLPLDAELVDETRQGESVLRSAQEIAKKADYLVMGEILQAREAAQAITSEAIERRADAVILGLGYERPFGEFQLQRTAQQVLRHAPCQVWICRQAPEEMPE